jgi:hypothetical protein
MNSSGVTAGGVELEQPSMFRRVMRGVGNTLSAIFFCNDPEDEELTNTQLSSEHVLSNYNREI